MGWTGQRHATCGARALHEGHKHGSWPVEAGPLPARLGKRSSCCLWFVVFVVAFTRVGEASNPGPGSVGGDSEATQVGAFDFVEIDRQVRGAWGLSVTSRRRIAQDGSVSDSNATDLGLEALVSDPVAMAIRDRDWDAASAVTGSLGVDLPVYDSEGIPTPVTDGLVTPRASRSCGRSPASSPSEAAKAGGGEPVSSSGRSSSAPGRKVFTLQVANSTGWGPMKQILSSTSAHVVMGTETWVTADEEAQESAWCRGAGWKALFSPAIPTVGRGRRAGVVVAVRSHIGLGWAPGDDTAVLVEGHIVVAHVAALVKGGYVNYTVYLHTREGMSDRNQQLVQTIGEHAAAHGRPWVAGGDWNVEPQELQESAAFAGLGGVVVSSGAPTCFSGEGGETKSELDYFVVDRRIASHFGTPGVDLEADTRPHRPVRVEVRGKLHVDTGVYLVLPRPFPLDRPVGPPQAPPDWSGFLDRCNLVRGAVLGGSEQTSAAAGELQPLWKDWCGRAERELGGVHDLVGDSFSRHCGRGEPPRLARKPCLGWKGHLRYSTTTDRGLLLRWLEVRLSDVAALTSKLREGRCETGEAWWGCANHRRLILKRIGRRFNADALALVGRPWDDRVRALAMVDSTSGAPCLEHLCALNSLPAWVAEVRVEARNEESLARSLRLKRWREFAKASTAGSAKAGHRWYKGASRWLPESVPVEDDDGDILISYAADDIANYTIKEWAGIWCVGDDLGEGAFMSEERFDELVTMARQCPLAAISVEQFRTVCLTFSRWTGLGSDGWHPRHWNQLGDMACESLIALLTLIETLLVWPGATREIVFARIPKEGGGHRLIGLMTSLYRVWTKLRRPYCTKWEGDHARSWDYASSGKGALAGAWDLGMEVEAAKAVGMQTAAYLSDLAKFYEHIPHALVLEKSAELGFPLTIALLAINQYGGNRRVSVDKCWSQSVCTVHGVVAGCSLATTLVKIVLIQVMDVIRARYPRLVLFVYLDDITLLWRGFRVAQLRSFVDAIADLVRMLEVDVHAKVSRDKTVVVASCRSFLEYLVASLSPLGFSGQHEVRQLGVDLSLERTARARRRPVRRRRFSVMRRRLPRLRRLLAAGADAAKLWVTGASPALSFGMAVLGCPPGCLLSARRSAGAACLPGGGGRSLTLGFIAHRVKHLDPICSLGIEPIVHWAKQVWMRAGGRLGIMKLGWRYASRKLAAAKQAWRVVSGPASATIASCTRLGWEMVSAVEVVSDIGVSFNLLEYSPLRLKRRLLEACERWQFRQVAAGLGMEESAVQLDWEALRFLLHGRRSPLDLIARGALRALVDGSAWDNVRCYQAGYLESPECALCGHPVADHHHHIWCCGARAGARGDALSLPVIEAGRAAPAGDPHWVRCLPAPLSAQHLEPKPYLGPQWIGQEEVLTGKVYLDGSAFDGRVRHLASGGYSAVMLRGSADQYTVVGFFSPLAGNDQTAGDAELECLREAVSHAVPPVCFVSDCAMVVDGFAKGRQWATSWRRVQADRWMKVFDAMDGWAEGSVSVLKVKAHRSARQRDQLDGQDREMWWGNYYADRWAKVGANSQRADSAARLALAVGRAHYRKVAAWASQVVGEEAAERPWRRDGARWEGFRPLAGRESVAAPRHEVEAVGDVWRCRHCTQWALTETSMRRLRSLPCGGSLARRAVRAVGAGCAHVLMRSTPIENLQGSGVLRPAHPIIWCLVCGAYAEEAARNILRACTGHATSAGQSARRWLMAGWHPRRYRRFSDPEPLDAGVSVLAGSVAGEGGVAVEAASVVRRPEVVAPAFLDIAGFGLVSDDEDVDALPGSTDVEG